MVWAGRGFAAAVDPKPLSTTVLAIASGWEPAEELENSLVNTAPRLWFETAMFRSMSLNLYPFCRAAGSAGTPSTSGGREASNPAFRTGCKRSA